MNEDYINESDITRLRIYQRKNSLTNGDLAEMLHIHRCYISTIFGGKMPGPTVRYRIMEFLEKVSPKGNVGKHEEEEQDNESKQSKVKNNQSTKVGVVAKPVKELTPKVAHKSSSERLKVVTKASSKKR